MAWGTGPLKGGSPTPWSVPKPRGHTALWPVPASRPRRPSPGRCLPALASVAPARGTDVLVTTNQGTEHLQNPQRPHSVLRWVGPRSSRPLLSVSDSEKPVPPGRPGRATRSSARGFMVAPPLLAPAGGCDCRRPRGHQDSVTRTRCPSPYPAGQAGTAGPVSLNVPVSFLLTGEPLVGRCSGRTDLGRPSPSGRRDVPSGLTSGSETENHRDPDPHPLTSEPGSGQRRGTGGETLSVEEELKPGCRGPSRRRRFTPRTQSSGGWTGGPPSAPTPEGNWQPHGGASPQFQFRFVSYLPASREQGPPSPRSQATGGGGCAAAGAGAGTDGQEALRGERSR